MTKLRLLGAIAALLAAALVGGTLISAVAASTTTPTTTTDPVPVAEPTATATPASDKKADREAYCATFRSSFAAALGKTEAEVNAAAKTAIGAAIDQAVTDGKLTADAASQLKAKVAAFEGDGCKLLGGWRGKIGHGGGMKKAALGVTKDAMTAAAGSLKMTLAELRTEFKAGKSLKDVATAKNVPYATVTSAVTTAVKTDLDAAVKAGTITQARADKVLARLTTRLENGWTKPGR